MAINKPYGDNARKGAVRKRSDFESEGCVSMSIFFSSTGANKSLRLQNADRFLRFTIDEISQLRADL